VWAMQNAAEDQVRRLIEIYQPTIRATDGSGPPNGDEPMSPALVQEVLDILERCGARAATEQEARRFRDLALGEARSLPVPLERVSELRALVESMISA
jgi:geranylgeranyl pyrophosphate synthase